MLSIEMIEANRFRVVTRHGDQVLMYRNMNLEEVTEWLASLSEGFAMWDRETKANECESGRKQVSLPA